ncbi:Fc.00g104390.m01.CDS01 [Cosmosporella sp. VM-42]
MAVIHDDKIMNSMFTAVDPEEHKSLKRPVAQKFSMTSIRTLEYLVDPCSNIFLDAMTDLQGQVVDLGAWVQWYAFDVIGAITFAQRFGFMERREDVNNVISGIEMALKYAGIVGQVPALHKVLLGNVTFRKILRKMVPSFHDPIAIVTQMVLDHIKEYDARDDNSMERADFLAYFRQHQKSSGDSMSTRDLMNHLMNNLLAGSDTTGISLRAVFYYALRDKRVYKKLQREIDHAHAAGKLSPIITYAESLQLEYLQLCVKEAMRMHPGVSYPLERIVPKGGINVCGIQLHEGTVVSVNPAVIHRDQEVFGADANEFRPERWFGAGVRTCIGKNISIMEMGKFVPQILRQFDLEWASPEPEWKVKTYWFARQLGLLVRFKPRKYAEALGS